ncbi:hypothetical protein MUY21_11200 [Aliiroseovarius sp. S2029]|uniref:hypothetical protein n=1 Tax=Aliiroseovarius sp. S2029 TaxID=2936988 RepID=UPI0020C042C0|nr:hypothetical protein [Aliiroseovarius sp. S2029]MCK8484601.1 hypothetical protein [Aliiroseovarius sp. S2029]
MFKPVLAALIIAASPAAAQDADGNDRPSNWRVTHQSKSGIWTTACDERGAGEALEQRCYIRWVDVFSPKPKFAALFVFITNADNRPEVAFGTEAGTLFSPGGFRIENGGRRVWNTLRPGCLTGLRCTFTGDDALKLIGVMQSEGEFAFEFRDRHGTSQSLRWPLSGFADALERFNAQSGLRGLPTLPIAP